ncbi:hypothetical protein [Pantoea septica]|uniref:hypothetical protein n=1 Tax=Pantoea septica TaxID=472695 RepID=UPI003D07AD7F
MEITYSVDYQYKIKGNDTPVSEGNVIQSSGEETPVMFIPVVGDYVEIQGNPAMTGEKPSFRGRVVSRLFRYQRLTESEVFCHVNIVVEESCHDFNKLVSE